MPLAAAQAKKFHHGTQAVVQHYLEISAWRAMQVNMFRGKGVTLQYAIPVALNGEPAGSEARAVLPVRSLAMLTSVASHCDADATPSRRHA